MVPHVVVPPTNLFSFIFYFLRLSPPDCVVLESLAVTVKSWVCFPTETSIPITIMGDHKIVIENMHDADSGQYI
jgi:hypothetical protein